MTPARIRWIITSVFFLPGGWALLWPQGVIDLTLLPEYRVGTPILPFVVACFGAQAMISGLFAGFSRFTKTTFLAYGLALIPFLVFNIWFLLVDPVFTRLGWLDALGNAVMAAMCGLGWRRV